MKPQERMRLLERLRNPDLLSIILYSILFLFFLQLISDFIEAIYAFGLMGTSLPVEIAAVLLLFSPLFLLLLRKGLSGWPLVLVGELMFTSRVAEPFLDTRGRMFVGGLGVACFLVLFPSLLSHQGSAKREASSLMLGTGMTLGLSLSILFRALNSGSDVSTYSWFQAIGWILAVMAGTLWYRLLKPWIQPARRPAPRGDKPARAGEGKSQPTFWRTSGLSLGLMGVFVLCYFAFASPNVIARWTGVSYLPIVSIIVLVLCLFAFLLTARSRLLSALTPGVVLAWNALFILAMVLTILAHQIRFPADAGSYPLAEPAVTLLHHIPLFLMLVLFPIILIDFVLFTEKLVARNPSSRLLGGGFALASLFLLLMIFAHIFTTVYDYIPLVGPFFRDRFWFVYLLAGIVLALPALLVSKRSFQSLQTSSTPKPGMMFPGLVVFVGLITICGAFLTAAKPVAPPEGKPTLKILTYNIQQGYSEDGLKNLDEQLGVIQEVNPDVIGLQECDTNRIAGGNSDVVRYFADKLDLHSYYGPKTVPGTFGIALLSKYPIENPRTFYMYSVGEQTATIEAQITVDDTTFNAYVTHLGNGGPIMQQEAILQELKGKENIIVMGDFNFRPDTDQYRLTTGVLEDSWLLRWPQGTDTQGIDPSNRIDYIFVSPGTRVTESWYLPGPQSDHPAMTATIEW